MKKLLLIFLIILIVPVAGHAVNCPPGTYYDEWATPVCQPCNPGRHCPGGENVTTNERCGAGYYCPPTTWTRTPCTAGSYCPGDTETTNADCGIGYFCPNTTTRNNCGAGNYCPTARLTAPTPCASGHYCSNNATDGAGTINGPNSTHTHQCPAGYYCRGNGTRSNCPAGNYCPGYVTESNSASPYYNGTNPGAAARSCPTNYSSDVTTQLLTEVTGCKARCLVGNHVATAASTTTIDSAAPGCVPLSGSKFSQYEHLVAYGSVSIVGTFTPAGSVTPTNPGTCTADVCACPGAYAIGNGDDDSAGNHDSVLDCAVNCAAGTQVATAAGICTTPGGTKWYTSAHSVNYAYTSAGPLGGGSHVNNCIANYSTPNSTIAADHDEVTDCKISCAAGYYIAAENDTSCANVESGYYSYTHVVSQSTVSGTDLSEDGTSPGLGRKRCPTGLEDVAKGNYDQSDGGKANPNGPRNNIINCFLTCVPGEYVGTQYGICIECPEGHACPGGKSYYGSTSTPIQCDPGYYCEANEQVRCPMGAHSKAGSYSPMHCYIPGNPALCENGLLSDGTKCDPAKQAISFTDSYGSITFEIPAFYYIPEEPEIKE